jgi:hypothetical protein
VPIAAIAAAVAVAVAAVALTSGGDDPDDADEAAAPTEIFLEPVRSVGPDPFGDDVSSPVPEPTIPPSTTAAPDVTGTPAGVPSVRGTAPGLYGGTQDQTACDAAAMVAYLEANPTKAAAWAEAIGIQPGQIRTYVDGLTPVLLQADTRVTNHGFRDDRPTPRQSVLQAGTAVLVDDTGVPRTRCACGNPLKEPQEAAQTFTGEEWNGFDPAAVQAIAPGPPTDSFVLRDVSTGQPFELPVGTGVASASTTTAPATTSTTAPAPAENVATGGAVQASSTYSAEFAAELAVDGDPTTSWFSAGVAGDGGDESLYVWTPPGGGTVAIDRIVVVGNAQHPEFPTGFGFNAVTVQVLGADGTTLFEQQADLAGTPDPNVEVRPGVSGARVALLFHGHEAPDCGGFAELEVYAS